MLHGRGHELGLGLVRHPATKAVAFTGSQRGGRALFDAAASRPHPIPVFAEMGSINPVLLLPGALAEGATQIGPAYVQSVTLGVGQFCTNPGLVLGLEGAPLAAFRDAVANGARSAAPATMLTGAIRDTLQKAVERARSMPGVRLVGESAAPAQADQTQAACVILATDAGRLNDQLLEENFGPSSLVVGCQSRAELLAVVDRLEGHLTASVHATQRDLQEYRDVIEKLEDKVGRIIYGGFGTGIEVCAGMHHGGPYPSSTFPQFTSIGHAAFLRFVRPVCYQNCPAGALPAALEDENPLGVWRLVDNVLTKA
jgi:NADP-dependent aldehyde dehydrogenase